MKSKFNTLLLIFILWPLSLTAQQKDILNQKIPIKAGTYTIEQLIEKIGTLKDVNLTYNSRDIPFQQKLHIREDNPTLRDILRQITKETVIEYQILDQYIILKKKKLSSYYHISGKVTDGENNAPMIGVNVFLKKNFSGTVTDNSGNFSFQISPGNYTLVFSFLGYARKEIPINVYTDQTINCSLTPEKKAIQEVKIIGQRQFFGDMDYGRDIPSIDAKTIEKQNENNASDILHARLAGVWATKTSGAPGDHEKIRIRGQTSFFSSAEPLYVVDGVPVPIVNLSSLGIADLNIHDIASVTVLKSASATAIYGFQGANGVVLIDTKQGGEKNEINFMVKTGVKWFNNFYPMMSSKDFLASLDSTYKIIRPNIRVSGFDIIKYYPAYTDSLCNTNWQKEIFKPGLVKEYQLSSSGTKGGIRYYLSGNYTNQGGIIPHSNYNRYTFSTRLSREFWKKLALGISYRGSVQNNLNNLDEYKGNRLLFEGINKSPCLKCIPDSLIYNDMGQINPRIYYDYLPLYYPETPQSIIANNTLKLTTYSNSANFFARLLLGNHLNMNVMESFMYRRSHYDSKFSGFTGGSYDVYFRFNARLTNLEDVILFNHQANLSYSNTFGKHTVNGVLAYRLYKDNLWWNVDSTSGTLPDHYYLKNSMAGYGPKGSVIRSINSYIGNLSYDYNKTYFVSMVANISKIKEGFYTNYYSFFPSLSFSWDIAKENLFKNIKWMNKLALYINWGRSGNYPLNGLTNDLYENVSYTTAYDSTDYFPSVKQIANHHLRHESTTETDYGVKSSFFSGRLSLKAAYYLKNIDNLIIKRDIPLYYGGGQQYLNIGRIAVNGVDLALQLIPLQNKDFLWQVNFDYSSSSQTVRKLYQGTSMTFSDPDMLMPRFVIKEGEPFGNIYGYKNLGKWTSADEKANTKLYYDYQGMKYLDTDTTDGKLTMTVIGNSIPKYTWDLTNIFQYKNFSVEFTWYAVWGVQKYNATRAATIMTGNNPAINKYIYDTIPAIRSKVFYESSLFIDDASFVRLKNLSFYYTPATRLFSKIRLTLSLSFENLVTFTKYRGYDPEATIFTDNNFSDNAIDRGAYPNPKAVYTSIGLKF